MASVTQLAENKYKIFVELGYNDLGKRIRRTKTVTVTSNRDLKNKIRDFELKCMEEDNEPIDNISFESFSNKWIENHVKPNLTLTTFDSYYQILKDYLLVHFGKIKLKDIKKFHIVEYLSAQKTMGPNKYMVLKSIFGKAVEWEVLKDNPMNGIKEPKREKKDVDFYNEAELNHLFEVLDNCYPKHRIMIKLAAIGGLRRAEIAGIREDESINYKEDYIYIDKQLRYRNGMFYLAPVKNNKPRKVYFPNEFMKELKTYHTQFKSHRMELGNLWKGIYDDNDEMINLLFVKEDGYPAHINSIGNEWTKIKKRYDLKNISFHQLRHSCASLMVKKGINFKVIQERLGHANIGITLDLYSHLEVDQHKKSTSAFDNIL